MDFMTIDDIKTNDNILHSFGKVEVVHKAYDYSDDDVCDDKTHCIWIGYS